MDDTGPVVASSPPSRAGHTVLLVVPEAQVRELYAASLRSGGCFVLAAESAPAAARLVSQVVPEAVVADSSVFGAGADFGPLPEQTQRLMLGEPPYGASAQPGGWTALAKPIVPRVLVTRVLAMLRRQHGGALVADDKPLRAGPIEVGRNVPGARVRTADGWIELMLSPTEHRLLQFLVASPNRTHSREAIALAVWGAGRVAARTVDQAVRRLRRHLAEAGAEALVKTVPRVGYRGHIPTRHRNGS